MDTHPPIEGLFIGQAAIHRLLAKGGEADQSASSHWRDRLKDYRVHGSKPIGYHGFGEQITHLKLHRRVGHFLMQAPYRRMGRAFDVFDHFYWIGKKVAYGQGRIFDYDMLRQVLTATCNGEHFSKMTPGSLFCVIGDGFGSLSSVLLDGVEGSRVVLVNLTQVLAVDLINVQKVLPGVTVALVETPQAAAQALADETIRLIAVRADQQELLRELPLGFVFNTVSMGEMNPRVVVNYFTTMRASRGDVTFFYCSNRIEKILPDGVVTRFVDYPWEDLDEIVFDELTPWHQAFYTYFPPKYHPFDGPIKHRLVKMAKYRK